jgi:hypothetical protein
LATRSVNVHFTPVPGVAKLLANKLGAAHSRNATTKYNFFIDYILMMLKNGWAETIQYYKVLKNNVLLKANQLHCYMQLNFTIFISV